MPKFKIPVVWQMVGKIEIEADTLEDAVQKVHDSTVPLPDGDYLEDSFEVAMDDYDIDYAGGGLE